jgi:hypothetical protein
VASHCHVCGLTHVGAGADCRSSKANRDRAIAAYDREYLGIERDLGGFHNRVARAAAIRDLKARAIASGALTPDDAASRYGAPVNHGTLR